MDRNLAVRAVALTPPVHDRLARAHLTILSARDNVGGGDLLAAVVEGDKVGDLRLVRVSVPDGRKLARAGRAVVQSYGIHGAPGDDLGSVPLSPALMQTAIGAAGSFLGGLATALATPFLVQRAAAAPAQLGAGDTVQGSPRLLPDGRLTGVWPAGAVADNPAGTMPWLEDGADDGLGHADDVGDGEDAAARDAVRTAVVEALVRKIKSPREATQAMSAYPALLQLAEVKGILANVGPPPPGATDARAELSANPGFQPLARLAPSAGVSFYRLGSAPLAKDCNCPVCQAQAAAGQGATPCPSGCLVSGADDAGGDVGGVGADAVGRAAERDAVGWAKRVLGYDISVNKAPPELPPAGGAAAPPSGATPAPPAAAHGSVKGVGADEIGCGLGGDEVGCGADAVGRAAERDALGWAKRVWGYDISVVKAAPEIPPPAGAPPAPGSSPPAHGVKGVSADDAAGLDDLGDAGGIGDDIFKAVAKGTGVAANMFVPGAGTAVEKGANTLKDFVDKKTGHVVEDKKKGKKGEANMNVGGDNVGNLPGMPRPQQFGARWNPKLRKWWFYPGPRHKQQVAAYKRALAAWRVRNAAYTRGIASKNAEVRSLQARLSAALTSLRACQAQGAAIPEVPIYDEQPLDMDDSFDDAYDAAFEDVGDLGAVLPGMPLPKQFGARWHPGKRTWWFYPGPRHKQQVAAYRRALAAWRLRNVAFNRGLRANSGQIRSLQARLSAALTSLRACQAQGARPPVMWGEEEPPLDLDDTFEDDDFGDEEFADLGSADDVGDLDGADDVGDLDGADDVGDLDGADDVGDLDGADDVGDLDGADDVAYVDGADDVGDLDGADDVGDLDGADDVGARRRRRSGGRPALTPQQAAKLRRARALRRRTAQARARHPHGAVRKTQATINRLRLALQQCKAGRGRDQAETIRQLVFAIRTMEFLNARLARDLRSGDGVSGAPAAKDEGGTAADDGPSDGPGQRPPGKPAVAEGAAEGAGDNVGDAADMGKSFYGPGGKKGWGGGKKGWGGGNKGYGGWPSGGYGAYGGFPGGGYAMPPPGYGGGYGGFPGGGYGGFPGGGYGVSPEDEYEGVYGAGDNVGGGPGCAPCGTGGKPLPLTFGGPDYGGYGGGGGDGTN